MSLEIKITSVQDSGNELMEADLVTFTVINGEPDREAIHELIENHTTSTCNINYCENEKAGSFVDTNFVFVQDQIISSGSSN